MGEKKNFYILCFVTIVAFGLNIFFSKPLDQNTEEKATPKVEKVAETSRPNPEEKYYVLQNDYQQIVFSNIGGAVCEVNLSLKTKDHAIHSIGLDKQILESNPNNARFPVHSALIATDTGTTATTPCKGGFTPLLRRDILSEDGKTLFKVHPKNYAIQLESDSYTPFTVKEFTKDKIVFVGEHKGQSVTKTYSFSKSTKDIPYTLNIDIDVAGEKKGLWLSSGIPEAELISSAFSPTLKYLNLASSSAHVKSITLPKDEETISSIRSGWSVNSNGFFGLILNPHAGKIKKIKTLKLDGDEAPSRLSLLANHNAMDFSGYQLYFPLQKSSNISSFNYFAGPLQKDVLHTVDTHLATLQNTHTSNLIAATDNPGWFSFIREPIAKLFMTIMKFFHAVTGSWGIAIILLTLTLRIIIYPLHQRSIKSTTKLANLNPKLKALQEKHKNDPQTLRMEMALLYRNAGVNPLSSILPLLLQLPFFFGIFDVLRYSFDLRGASFIPGWIDNLSAPDTLFSWGFHIPIIGDGLHILPLISCLLMFLQQKISAPSASKDGNKGPMGGSMGMIMCAVFAVLFYTMPAGLNIYMIVSTGFALIQHYFSSKKQKKPLLSKKLRQ